MAAVIITMALIMVLAVAVAGVVAVGMRGKFSEADPRLRSGLAEVARHLNGDAEAPRALSGVAPSSEQTTAA